MKSFAAIATLAASAVAMGTLQETESLTKLGTVVEDKFPAVETLHWSDAYEDNGFGIGFYFGFDLDLGYEMPIFWNVLQDNYVVMNPVFYGEISSKNYIEIMLFFVNFRFNIDLIGYRAEPFNFVFSWNLDDLANCCYGLSWAAEGLDFNLDLEVYSNECSVGLFGAIFDHETFTCSMTQYTPAQHLLSFSAYEDEIDFGDEWVPYQCNNY
jgi:hypothetical protein